MEAVFLVKSLEKLNNVYQQEALKQFIPDLLPIKAYIKEDIIDNKETFRTVKYIFSTWYMPTFTEEEIQEYFPDLQAVFYAAGTVKYFARPFLKAGIHVFSAGIANAIPVAEFVVSQVILANKGYFQAQKAYRKPFFKLSYNWAHKYVETKIGNYNAKIGLIGAGMVATKAIELLKSHHLEIYSYDPYVSKERLNEMGASKVELKELFENCDVISNHLPDIAETKGILNYSLFSSMKPAATFINTGRGVQVVEKDLIRALKEKPMRCALLDVTGHEPLWPWSSFYRMNNVFVTPHIAGSMCQEEQRMAEFMFQAYEDYKYGKQNTCEITMETFEKMA